MEKFGSGPNVEIIQCQWEGLNKTFPPFSTAVTCDQSCLYYISCLF